MERLLLRKAKQGDADAFCRLMETQMQSMNKIARAYLENEEDVADAVQDTILSCYEKLCTLEQDRYFKTWLVRILINKCQDVLRRGKRVVCMEYLPETAAEDNGYSQMEWKHLLAGLDEKYRTILLLYYLEGFNTKEISVLLEMNESTVKSRLQRGREQLKMRNHLPGKEVRL